MKRFIPFLLLLSITTAFVSCKKSKVDAIAPSVSGDGLVGSWKLTKLEGKIDSAITINGATNTTKFTFAFDSESNKITQKINDVIKYQYPYALTLTFNDNGHNQITERYTRANNAGVLTPYYFNTTSTWNYVSTNNPYDGIVIRGFDKTAILGDYRINASTTASSNYIRNFLLAPSYNSYDKRTGVFLLYVHTIYNGNADSNNGGVVTNPFVKITADYVLTFSKTTSPEAGN